MEDGGEKKKSKERLAVFLTPRSLLPADGRECEEPANENPRQPLNVIVFYERIFGMIFVSGS